MPFETWDNLPEQKRERVLKVMTIEFATHGYADASLNRIAATAEISKGSLFQYFTNKLDMWQVATAASAERAWNACVHAAGPADIRVDERLSALCLAWLRHFRDSETDRVLAAATIDSNATEARQLFRQTSNQLYAIHVGQLVDEAVQRGDVLAKDADNLATMTILLLRFLANAPFTPDRDPILGLHQKSWDDIETASLDLMQSMVQAFLSG